MNCKKQIGTAQYLCLNIDFQISTNSVHMLQSERFKYISKYFKHLLNKAFQKGGLEHPQEVCLSHVQFNITVGILLYLKYRILTIYHCSPNSSFTEMLNKKSLCISIKGKQQGSVCQTLFLHENSHRRLHEATVHQRLT